MTPAPTAARERRERSTFWIDDAILDTYAPVMRRYRFGMAALAVYVALARRADRDGLSWPSLGTLAKQAAASERTVQRAIQLLELLGLVGVTTCFEAESHRQTSNLYTLLTPPPVPPEVDLDPAQWPAPCRSTLVLPPGPRSHAPAEVCARPEPAPQEAPPRLSDTPPVTGWRGAPVSQTPRPRQPVTPPPVSQSPLEGTPREVCSVKEDDDGIFARATSFAIAEIGLSSGQVWAATLAELARGGAVRAADLAAWLQPAALCGREGDTLLLGVPSRVAQERITARLLPAVRAALATVLGTPLPVRVVVLDDPAGGEPAPASRRRYPGIGTRPPPNEWRDGLALSSVPRTVTS